MAVAKAGSKGMKKSAMQDVAAPRTLIPAAEVVGTTAHSAAAAEADAERAQAEALAVPAPREVEKTYDADSVFAKLKGLKLEEDK